MEPLMLISSEGDPLPSKAMIDDGYIAEVCPDWKEIYITKNSDEIFSVGIGPADEFLDLNVPHKLHPLEVARWAQIYTTDYHRHLFQQKIRLHVSDLSERWIESENDADRISNRIAFWLKFLEKLPPPLIKNSLLKKGYKFLKNGNALFYD